MSIEFSERDKNPSSECDLRVSTQSYNHFPFIPRFARVFPIGSSIFLKPKKDIFGEFCDRRKHYGKFMEWQDDDDDRRSSTLENVCSLSWSGKNILGRSKSDSRISVIEDCNYRTQGTQVSLKSCNTAKNVTSILENFNLNNDDSDDVIDDDLPTVIIDYPTYNQFDYGYGIKTKDVTTKETIMQKPEILNFQGNKHRPDEIAPYWKKDCRMWLWKSVRLAQRKNQNLYSCRKNMIF